MSAARRAHLGDRVLPSNVVVSIGDSTAYRSHGAEGFARIRVALSKFWQASPASHQDLLLQKRELQATTTRRLTFCLRNQGGFRALPRRARALLSLETAQIQPDSLRFASSAAKCAEAPSSTAGSVPKSRLECHEIGFIQISARWAPDRVETVTCALTSSCPSVTATRRFACPLEMGRSHWLAEKRGSVASGSRRAASSASVVV